MPPADDHGRGVRERHLDPRQSLDKDVDSLPSLQARYHSYDSLAFVQPERRACTLWIWAACCGRSG